MERNEQDELETGKETEHKFSNHNPKLALLLSVIPGLGQFYNRRFMKGAFFLIFGAAFLITLYDFLNIGLWGIFTLGTQPIRDHSLQLIIQGLVSIILIAFALLIYGINLRDAYKDAEKLKEGFGIPTLREAFHNTYDKTFPYFLVGPGLILVIFSVILPLGFMLSLAFVNYSLRNTPPHNLLDWVGLDNFIALATTSIFQQTFISVFSWTLVWTLVATTLQIALGLFLAILVNDKRVKFKRTFRTLFILPWAVPGFVSILIFAAMFNDGFGAINRQIMEPLLNISIPWMTDVMWTRVAIITIQVWLGFPFVFALFTGVLQSISDDWYEAATVDGANRWQKFKAITFPHVMYATAPLLIMQYTGNFNNFNIIYLFNEGGPAVRGQNAGGTDILISWVYSLTFQQQNYSIAAAISMIIGLVIAVFAFFQFRKTKSYKEEGKVY
ncbi:sugar ABC transporter permease [Evansella cellulosilytica]|uniref:Maltose/maltodextrin transport system permease protein n=1 Tax=Evansella cellulosilytica (strain ATCC 21833 / DSM 2522 / FERM P-1141 / JCM 9156 / N-4) TaxID=649639 RepID=E6TY02_EVAC2|nr:sugar ABC transporter permease [Evansella cellulosilytica]ADU31215.1 binding-protein-dependent transport systems inner membrane component [Evansella cellulosilytica DSM 2522]